MELRWLSESLLMLMYCRLYCSICTLWDYFFIISAIYLQIFNLSLFFWIAWIHIPCNYLLLKVYAFFALLYHLFLSLCIAVSDTASLKFLIYVFQIGLRDVLSCGAADFSHHPAVSLCPRPKRPGLDTSVQPARVSLKSAFLLSPLPVLLYYIILYL